MFRVYYVTAAQSGRILPGLSECCFKRSPFSWTTSQMSSKEIICFLPLLTALKEMVGIFGEGWEILSMFSRKGWRKFGLSPSPPLTEHSPTPLSPTTPPLPTCIPPINRYHLYMLPNSLLYTCGFFRAVVAYFLPL